MATTAERLQLGKCYSRTEIREFLGGGSVQDVLLSKKGRILGGCFIAKLNPGAPARVYIGNDPQLISRAEQVANERLAIPIFVKRGTEDFKYLGSYRFSKIGQTEEEVKTANEHSGRDDVWGILYFDRQANGQTR